jgi:hypothetical protein
MSWTCKPLYIRAWLVLIGQALCFLAETGSLKRRVADPGFSFSKPSINPSPWFHPSTRLYQSGSASKPWTRSWSI